MSVTTVDYDGAARFCADADPAIKLFGRDIPLTSSTSHEASEDPSVSSNEQLSYQDIKPEILQIEECNEPMDIISNQSEMATCVVDGNEAMGTLSIKKPVGDQIILGDSLRSTDIKGEESQGLSAASHEKMPKKPEKLIPCPRCHSLDTKFCYFNNYNVNQPRHFCRKCQRYWTAGGTLRNVPVGAGRRKHKHSISHQKHVIVSDSIPARTNAADMAHHRCSVSFPSGGSALSSPSKPMLHVLPLETHVVLGVDNPSSKSTMLSFGQESPLCKSMAATTLRMQECGAMRNHEILNANASASGDMKVVGGGKLSSEVQGLTCNIMSSSTHDVPATVSKKLVSSSCPTFGSPAIGAAMPSQEGELKVSSGNEVHGMQLNEAGYTDYGGVWQLVCNMMSNTPFNPAAANTLQSESALNAAPSLPPLNAAPSLPLLNAAPLLPPTNMLSCNGGPGSFWTGFPWPLMNPAMWGPPPVEWAGPWTLPFCPPAAAAAGATAAALFPFSGAASAFEKPQQPEASQPEKCLWVPKTLRIDDPLDAARSSIWATLGLGDGPLRPPVNGSTKAFQVKSDFKDYNETINSQQHTNPAASSRSAAFHENS